MKNLIDRAVDNRIARLNKAGDYLGESASANEFILRAHLVDYVVVQI